MRVSMGAPCWPPAPDMIDPFRTTTLLASDRLAAKHKLCLKHISSLHRCKVHSLAVRHRTGKAHHVSS